MGEPLFCQDDVGMKGNRLHVMDVLQWFIRACTCCIHSNTCGSSRKTNGTVAPSTKRDVVASQSRVSRCRIDVSLPLPAPSGLPAGWALNAAAPALLLLATTIRYCCHERSFED